MRGEALLATLYESGCTLRKTRDGRWLPWSDKLQAIGNPQNVLHDGWSDALVVRLITKGFLRRGQQFYKSETAYLADAGSYRAVGVQ